MADQAVTDQYQAAPTQLAYNPALFGFVKQRPAVPAVSLEGHNTQAASMRDSSRMEHRNDSSKVDRQNPCVRLPDAPLAIRKMPAPSVHCATGAYRGSATFVPPHSPLALQQQTALPLRPASSSSSARKSSQTCPSSLSKSYATPLLTKLTKLTSVPEAQVTSGHVAGVVPPHTCSLSGCGINSQLSRPAPLSTTEQTSSGAPLEDAPPEAQLLSGSDRQELANTCLPNPCNLHSAHLQPSIDSGAGELADTVIAAADKPPDTAASYQSAVLSQPSASQPTPPTQLHEPDTKPKSAVRSRLRLQRLAAPGSPCVDSQGPASQSATAVSRNDYSSVLQSLQASSTCQGSGHSPTQEPRSSKSAAQPAEYVAAEEDPFASSEMPVMRESSQRSHAGPCGFKV